MTYSARLRVITPVFIHSLLGLAAFALVTPAQAQNASESFSYTPGSSLNGQNGGSGWANSWAVATPTSATITAGNQPDPSGKLAVSGNSVSVHANAGQFLVSSRNLAFTLGTDNTTEWLGFMIARTSPNAGTTNPPPYGGVALGTSAGLFVGDTGDGKWGMDTSGPMALNSVVDASGSSASVTTNAPTFLVVRADFLPGSDTFTLYQNPTPGLSAPDVSGVVKTDLNQTATSALQLAYGNGNTYTVDEVRLGSSYAAVAPVPEASTTVSFGFLLTLGFGGLLIAAKRRRAQVE